MKYKYPENLYTDVRIEESTDGNLYIKNGEIEGNSDCTVIGAIVRVFDGKLWYTTQTNNLDEIQNEIDNLAKIAKPNKNILKNKIVKNFQVNKDTVLKFEGENNICKVTRKQREELLNHYLETCVDTSIEAIKMNHALYDYNYKKKSFYSSKGAEIIQDYQRCRLMIAYEVNVNDLNFQIFKQFYGFTFDELKGHEDEVLAERTRCLEFAEKSVPVEPGEYCCVLSPTVTSVFTHESFGHKSESDFMLNDKTLQEEWKLGKKVGNEKVTIIDEGQELYHGYCPYDDEGTVKEKVYLMTNGILTGRLHDAKSAATLNEKMTGNARAQNYKNVPMVRMTNTYMDKGPDDPEEIIKGVKNGLYIYDWNYGTGNSTFTIQPRTAYKIIDGKIADPVRINVVTGNVFQTLFDIDAVGTDLEFFSGICGKNGQAMFTATGGPTIRVKNLTIN